MKTVSRVLVLLVPLFVVSCQSAPTSPDALFGGQSHADEVLRKDTVDIITTFVIANGCSSIDHVETDVLYHDARQGVKHRVWSKEEWLVTGCAQNFPFSVSYAEDGADGTFIKVAAKNANDDLSDAGHEEEKRLLEKARAAFGSRQYAEALALLEPMAERGNPGAQNGLAVMYARGLGVRQDLGEAFKWHKKAALQGYALAQFFLGLMYADGQGVAQDAAQGAGWLRAAAQQGLPVAQFSLAAMYARGEGVGKDSYQAAAWYRKAAEQGHALAQHNLALLYLSGEGVPRNPAEAFRWEQKAAELGDENAQFGLGILYAKGVDGVPRNYVEAYRWIRKAAERGYPLQFEFESGWTIGHFTAPPNQYLIEFIREGDDIDNWKELLTLQVFPPNWGGVSVTGALDQLKALREKICPGVTEWNVIDRDEKSILYEWHARPCRGWPDQHEIARIIYSVDRTTIIRYTQKNYQMPDDQRNTWIKKFLDVDNKNKIESP